MVPESHVHCRKATIAIEGAQTDMFKEKKWAEARREEEEDFNLSPWFIVKPFSVLTFILPTQKE